MLLTTAIGNLGGDPEERFTSTGKKVITLNLATKTGVDETTWVRISIWDNKFEKILPHLKKGSSVIVIGELKTPRLYQTSSGETRISIELIPNSIKFNGSGSRQTSETNADPCKTKSDSLVEEDLPF